VHIDSIITSVRPRHFKTRFDTWV